MAVKSQVTGICENGHETVWTGSGIREMFETAYGVDSQEGTATCLTVVEGDSGDSICGAPVGAWGLKMVEG